MSHEENPCRRCGELNPGHLRFCASCGALLQETPASGAASVGEFFPAAGDVALVVDDLGGRGRLEAGEVSARGCHLRWDETGLTLTRPGGQVTAMAADDVASVQVSRSLREVQVRRGLLRRKVSLGERFFIEVRGRQGQRLLVAMEAPPAALAGVPVQERSGAVALPYDRRFLRALPALGAQSVRYEAAMVAPPPPRVGQRALSAAMALRLLLCGLWCQIGAGLLLFGLPFLWAFVGGADVYGLLFFNDPAHTVGWVLEEEATTYSVNEEDVMAYRFAYEVDGTPREAVSFSLEVRTLPVGTEVEVEYMAHEPARARIRGMRMAPFSGAIAIVGIMPWLVGVMMFVVGVFLGRKKLALLRVGAVSQGRVIKRSPTNTRVNGRTVYKHVVHFVSSQGQLAVAYGRTHRTELLEAEEQLVLYDPQQPHRSYLVGLLPRTMRIGDTRVEGNPGVLCFMLPVAAVVTSLLFFGFLV